MCDDTVQSQVGEYNIVQLIRLAVDWTAMDKSDDTAQLFGLAEYSLNMCDDTVQLLRLTVGSKDN
jgi:hypothetical protein